MKGSRAQQAASSSAATPARWRRPARYLALAVASAASIATSPAPGEPHVEYAWEVSDSAAQSFVWEDPSSDIPPETWSARMHVTLQAPRGRWRVDLRAMQGQVLANGCTWADSSDGSFTPTLELAALTEQPWGDFSGRCVGLCPPAHENRLEFTCDAATCSGTTSLPVVAALLHATEFSPQVCVSATVRGPAETTALEPPSGVSIEVMLDPFVEVEDTPGPDGGAQDGGIGDAGTDDAGAPDAGAADAGASDAMAEGAADAS
jgi:hypothetical protein